MGFFDFIKSKINTNWKATLVKDLVMLTAVDGDMDKDEIKLVLNIAVNELGFSEKEFINLMQKLGDVKDVYPSDANDKIKYITSLIKITYSDGFLADNEMKYMKIIAKRMNLSEDIIDKTIAYIANSSGIVESINPNKDAYFDDSSIGKIIITSPFEPTVDIQSEEGIKNYFSKISKLAWIDLCIELSNIMSAKHNLTAMPSGINSFSNNQKLVTDLTDKALIICMYKFGQQTILEYCGEDLRQFNELVNNIDEEIAQLDLVPAQHGNEMLNKILTTLSKQ